MPSQAQLRDLRASEPWLIYDSICIGPGAGDVDNGWFNSWTEFAAAGDKLKWFFGARKLAPKWATNVSGEREDFSLYLYQGMFEIVVPPGVSGLDRSGVDQTVVPLLVPYLLSTFLSMQMKLGGVDVTLVLPASHLPASTGIVGGRTDGAAGPTSVPGSVGVPAAQNTWKFAEPQSIPRQGRWSMEGFLDEPARGFLRNLEGPSAKQVPAVVAGGDTAVFPNWTVLRVSMRGYRNVQLRGARSSG